MQIDFSQGVGDNDTLTSNGPLSTQSTFQFVTTLEVRGGK